MIKNSSIKNSSIELFVSKDCPYCETQQNILLESFGKNGFKINVIEGSNSVIIDDYEVDAVPFILIRNDKGKVIYANKGIHDEIMLKEITNRIPRVYNHKKLKK